MGIQWRIRYRLCFELALKYLISKAIILLWLFNEKGKRLQRCVYNVSARWTVKTDKFTLFVYCNFLVLLSTTVCSQNINKQNVNIADETLTDYNFLSRYHDTKSKNYLKRRYRIRHWIPMFFGTPCIFHLHSTDIIQLCWGEWRANFHSSMVKEVTDNPYLKEQYQLVIEDQTWNFFYFLNFLVHFLFHFLFSLFVFCSLSDVQNVSPWPNASDSWKIKLFWKKCLLHVVQGVPWNMTVHK